MERRRSGAFLIRCTGIKRRQGDARAWHGENRLPAPGNPCVVVRLQWRYVIAILSIISYSRSSWRHFLHATEDLLPRRYLALMVGISTLLNFVREARSTKAADALKAMIEQYRYTVLRVVVKWRHGWNYPSIMVPDDKLLAGGGDMIGSLRIIEARDLFVARRN